MSRDTPGWRFAVLLCLLLAGCGRDPAVTEADNKMVCSLDGKSFRVTPRVGDLSLVQRIPETDILCKEYRK